MLSFISEILAGISVVAVNASPYTFDQHETYTMNKFDSTQLRTQFDNIGAGCLGRLYRKDCRLPRGIEFALPRPLLLSCGFGFY